MNRAFRSLSLHFLSEPDRVLGEPRSYGRPGPLGTVASGSPQERARGRYDTDAVTGPLVLGAASLLRDMLLGLFASLFLGIPESTTAGNVARAREARGLHPSSNVRLVRNGSALEAWLLAEGRG